MICVHIKDFDAKNLCKNKFPSILRFVSIKIYSLAHNEAEVPNNRFCFVSIDTYLWLFAKISLDRYLILRTFQNNHLILFSPQKHCMLF